MNALSEEPGTWFGLQLAATFQLPPAVFVQVMVAACMEIAVNNAAISLDKRRVIFIRFLLENFYLATFRAGVPPILFVLISATNNSKF